MSWIIIGLVYIGLRLLEYAVYRMWRYHKWLVNQTNALYKFSQKAN